MKSFFLLLMLSISWVVRAQNYGVALRVIDDSIRKDIVILKFEYSQAVIFPASYAQKLFGNQRHWDEYRFYTPDSALVRRIDKEILDQYCAASTRFNDSTWKNTIAYSETANDKLSLKLAKKQMLEFKQRFAKYCERWKANGKYWSKQYIGYLNPQGEKMIYVQLLDFRIDPYQLQGRFESSWIDGWHGWFETNRKTMHYHVDKHLLTINEDI
jgi:hypothetical protein